MKRVVASTLLVLLHVWCASADDVVGVTRVSVPSNGVAAAVLPYSPIDGPFPDSFVSGPFIGDGGEQSDILCLYSADGNAITNFVWDGIAWIDPVSGTNASVTVSPNDIVALMPYEGLPFDFFLFGRHDASSLAGGFPRFSTMHVDPAGGFADMEIAFAGKTTDLLVRDADDICDSPSDWLHVERFAGDGPPFVWRDLWLSGSATNRLYMVSDAMRDSDHDGIPDGMELYVYGTSPVLDDTDGDGISDGFEVAWGMNPAFADFSSAWRFFEPFELPDVGLGELSGQHGWRVNEPSSAIVQTKTVRSGRAALELHYNGDEDRGSVILEHTATNADGVVWVDGYCVAVAASHPPIIDDSTKSGGFFFSQDAHPVMIDGSVLVTNPNITVAIGEWTRFTCRIDYFAQNMDLYIDGRIAGEGLRFASSVNSFSGIGVEGHDAMFVDDFTVSGVRPRGLSSDGDAMPDEWEFRHFGTLDRDGTGDADGDGLSDYEEFRHMSNPLVKDSDRDGLSDAVEVNFYGTSPCSRDTDGDGVSDADEIANDTDPLVADASADAEFFESFELPDVNLGELDGQNGWVVSVTNVASVQDSVVRSGAAALKMTKCESGPVLLSRPSVDSGSALWVDMYQIARAGVFQVTDFDGSGGFFFDGNGYVVTFDGESMTTNRRVCAGLNGWVRTTLHIDYPACTFDLYISGILVARGLPIKPMPEGSPHGIEFVGESETAIDDIRISQVRPHGLSSDGDLLSDDWELRNFGTLDRTGFGDADRDGLKDIDEFKAGTDPNSADTDGDGLPDRWETVCGTDPNDPDDATADPDGDGMDNMAEYSLGFDPLNADTDPRMPPEIDLKTDRPWYLVGQTVRVTASAVDADGTVKELTIYRDGIRLVHVYGADASSAYQAASCASTNAVEALAADSSGKSALVCLYVPVFESDADSDCDGLTNAEEQLLGTDPLSPDTDRDGIPDIDEVRIGTDPVVADAHADPDGDGLTNVEEIAHGSDLWNPDTDGDGCPDGQEVHNVRSDPLCADIAWTNPVELGGDATGASFISSTGTWRSGLDGVVYAAERAGSLTWRLHVPEGGADALAVRVEQHEFYAKASTFDLSLKVDGLFVSRQTVSAPYGSPADAFFFLPEILGGEHEFVITWHNWNVNTFLAVHHLRFVRFSGPDEDVNGIADWKDCRNGTSTVLEAPPFESLVSPLCVEGKDLWRDVLEVDVGYPSTNASYAVIKTIGDGFFADIPLSEDGVSVISLSDRALTNAFPVVWSEFNPFSGEYETNAIVIRKDDSLRISGYGNSENTVAVSRETPQGEWICVSNWMQTASVPYKFGTPGRHLVYVSSQGSFGVHEAFALVDVVNSRFPKRNPAVQMDVVREMPCPSLSPRGLIEHDPELFVEASIDDSGGVNLSLLTHSEHDLGLVSRIDGNGAIFDAIQVTPVWFDNGSYYHVAQTYPDGSQLVEVSLLLGAMPEGLIVRLDIFVSGATFEDGTRRKLLTADDLDGNGHCTVRFIRARGATTSVCHRTYIYQDGELIYTNR